MALHQVVMRRVICVMCDVVLKKELCAIETVTDNRGYIDYVASYIIGRSSMVSFYRRMRMIGSEDVLLSASLYFSKRGAH